jgi:hypothetical protein
VPDDDAVLRARLQALEAEVKADADAARARKEAALAKVREQRAKELAERQSLRDRQAELVSRRARRPSAPPDDAAADHDDGDGLGGVGNALQLAQKAQGMRAELARPRKAGEKSWVTSGALSLFFGPIGWLYAGSFREAIPATAAWLALAALFTKVLPFMTFIMLPALLVALPLSGITGIVYAMNYNKHGKRTRLFGKDKEKKKLAARTAKQLPKG